MGDVADARRSSAKDQLTGQAVAVKKIMKPFSTPVLSKRTYRELKLLKHLKHENVGSTIARVTMPRRRRANWCTSRSSVFRTSSSRPSRTCTSVSDALRPQAAHPCLQLFRHRIARHGPAPATHLAAAGEAVHPVLPLPDPGKCRDSLRCPIRPSDSLPFRSAASSTSTPPASSIAISNPPTSSSTRTATSRSAISASPAYKTRK